MRKWGRYHAGPSRAPARLHALPPLRRQPSVHPLDEFDRELFAPDAGKPPVEDAVPGRPGTPGEPADRLDEELLRELAGDDASEDENPLLGIAQDMRSAEGMIGRTESGPATQDLQDRIVADLDELIKQARSRCGQCSPS